MSDFPECHGHLPNLSGQEERLGRILEERAGEAVYGGRSDVDFAAINSAFAIGLHMHQPLVPAGGADLATAAIISNLQHMLNHPHLGDNHNARVFQNCYQRMGEIIPRLIRAGRSPRVMLDYSGTLLHGLWAMGLHDVFDDLKRITLDAEFNWAVEWLGTPWGHPVAPSTPVQDYRLHVRAWQHHFAALFGEEALVRVRGFSPSEMALPNHPDVAYAFVRTLRDCGYRWVLVQEHTVEQPANGWGPERPHLPHRLVCTSSTGEQVSIIAVIKTQGSDSKLVGQMQPYYEARNHGRWTLGSHRVPPLVTQIADGENGGVMMNEFPPKYMDVMKECTGTPTRAMNVTEYLELLFASGVTEADLPVLQPLHQKALWDRFRAGDGPEKLEQAIQDAKQADHRFHMDGGSWTNHISWVAGYDNLLDPMLKTSARFNEKVLVPGIATDEQRYRNALYHLLCSQTSCYRYWGQGQWTDYGREICRRTGEILQYDF
ncbi:MAG: glycosyl hydrolase family 57 [Magnetococcales bacterium]|nr:glycosyl hydrolase family 57 [Magnetococcales bacterium]